MSRAIMSRCRLLVFLVLASAPVIAQAPPTVPSEAYMGRLHLLAWKLADGRVGGLPAFTRGAEPLVAPDAPHALNHKFAFVIPSTEADMDLLIAVLKAATPVPYATVDVSAVPNVPAGTEYKAVSATTQTRMIVRPHAGNHGPINFPHYDFVTFYPMPPH